MAFLFFSLFQFVSLVPRWTAKIIKLSTLKRKFFCSRGRALRTSRSRKGHLSCDLLAFLVSALLFPRRAVVSCSAAYICIFPTIISLSIDKRFLTIFTRAEINLLRIKVDSEDECSISSFKHRKVCKGKKSQFILRLNGFSLDWS